MHNERRALHQNTPALTYDTKMEEEAQQWADHLASANLFSHEPGQVYGENLGYAWSTNPQTKSQALDKTIKGW